ncbi:hypothetical protein CES85_5076 [Ochrobactrum quorumnocens]|uniref:Uncharacterized protein n=1 Tax=Ochrobactrum quorumnocens TaxID=271865 RepID=A0A248UC97_9HYPH|nr:hypothetical protein CES85_5076 [[Ochrobactrum] quorumnocens]
MSALEIAAGNRAFIFHYTINCHVLTTALPQQNNSFHFQ